MVIPKNRISTVNDLETIFCVIDLTNFKRFICMNGIIYPANNYFYLFIVLIINDCFFFSNFNFYQFSSELNNKRIFVPLWWEKRVEMQLPVFYAHTAKSFYNR